jgi:hypothetical protein
LKPAILASTTSLICEVAENSRPKLAWPEIAPGISPDGMVATFSAPQLSGAVAVTLAGMKARQAETAFLLLHFDDDTQLQEPDFPAHWRGFLALLNRTQFLPWFHVVSTRLARTGAASEAETRYAHFIAEGSPAQQSAPAIREATGRLAECELAQPSVRAFLMKLHTGNLPWPELDYEFMNNGRIVGTSALAWPERQVALFTIEQTEEIHAFTAAGWRTFSVSEAGWPEAEQITFIETFLTSS